MKKFLLSWILIVTFIFFDLPLRTQADTQTYYTYLYYGSSSSWDVPADVTVTTYALATIQLKDIFNLSAGQETFDFYYFGFPYIYMRPNSMEFVDNRSYFYFDLVYNVTTISTTGNISAFSGGVIKPINFDAVSHNPLNMYLYPHYAFYFKPHPAFSFSFNISICATTNSYIDTSGTDTYLISIDSDLKDISSKLSSIQSVLSSGFGTINTDLLNILNVLNQIAASGGSGGTGTAAIVGAVNGATAAIGQVLAQQQTSSADIVGAVNSQTSSLNNAIQGQTNSLNSTLSLVDASVNKITSTLEQDKQDNINAATEKGNELTGMATQIKNTAETSWDALSFPIDFTNQVFQVFSGGTSSAAYTRAYGDVLGYRYNSDTGGLEPIYRRYRDGIPRVTGGTTITFPAFSLPVPGVGTLQLWDSYEFDLSVISGYLPALFDALHLIIGILLIYWVIGYLIDLGHDIIG